MKGKYNTATGLSTCTLCVGEQAYAPYTGMTTCFQCIDKRQISDPNKTYCFVCKDGEYEDRPNSQCLKCPIGKYSDGTTNRKCVPCREGTYAVSIGTDVCTKCKACPDGFYRVNCTITAGGGYCLECEKCSDPKTDVRVDCMNRAGHNNASGICRKREFTVRNPYCDLQGAGNFLGGYPFQELFGTSQDSADFQCRGICDGVTNRLTDEMKAESNLVQYKNESFDSGYCKGPYACDVPTCVIYGVSDDSQPAYRLPAACPVVIDDALTEQLWAVTTQANYKQDPLAVAVHHMRYSVECQACSTCGEIRTDLMQVWPLMQNYTDWGRGCARECTELGCELGEIFDWTVSDSTRKCRPCSELEDVRLCTTKQQQGFAAADISGSLPKLTFKDCQPKRIVQDGIARASYGDCLQCLEINDACLGQPGLYYATCDVDLTPVCKKCDTKASALSSYFNGTYTLPLYCQKTLCKEGFTGVTVDVLPHRTCHRQCSNAKCASDRVELPCLLPHDKRCKASISYTDFPADDMYKKQAYVPAHANVLERVSGLHLFSSFENVLLSVQSIPLQRRRACVWNTDGIVDNDMNPAGISVHFQEACRPWTRDPGTRYPLLPMQNTVTDSTEFQRRILLNTSAIAMHYASEWQNVQRIPNVFTGDVFLDLELTNTSHTALAAFVSPDRLLSNVTSVVRWHVSVYAQQTVGIRDDVLIGIETPDDVEHCDECFDLQVACMPPDCTPVTCLVGTYSSVVDSIPVCIKCPAGTYSASSGTSACSSCPVNSTSPVSSTSFGSCVCSAGFTGTYSAAAGYSACTNCESGTYKNSSGTSACSLCPAGSYSATSGSSACTNCESGKYQTSSGTSVCSSCPANSTSPVSSTAIMSCVCSAGFTGNAACANPSSSNLQLSCGGRCGTSSSSVEAGQKPVNAIDGNYNSYSITNNANPWWMLDFGNTKTVTTVSVVQYSDTFPLQDYRISVGESTDASQNAICAAGLYGTQTVICPTQLDGRYLHISQGPNKMIIREVTVAGFDGVCPVLGCNACPAGTYKNSSISGTSVCVECPAGSYSAAAGSSACTNCESGKYKTSSGTSVCLSCPGNSTSPVSSTAPESCVCIAGFTGKICRTSDSSDNLQWSCGGRCDTAASSVEGDQYPTNAIDGNDESIFIANNPNPWWRLDFRNTKTVTRVSTRAYYYSYMYNYKITVGESPNANENAICASGLTGDQTVICPTPLTGRYLHISQGSNYMVIKEVTVAGFDGDCPAPGCNACPAGTYKNISGSSVCTSCPAGAYLNVVGATSCYTTATSTAALTTTTTSAPTTTSTTTGTVHTTTTTPAPTSSSSSTAARTTTTTPTPTPSSISTTNTSLSCSTAPHSAFRTSQAAAAWQDFCGDKFHVSVPNGSVYVCDESMQRRVLPGYTPSHAALSVLAGTLQTTCAEESAFSLQLPTSNVLIGGTESVTGRCCLGFVFSNTSVFCMSVEGVLSTVSDSGLHPDAFTVQSVVVYQDSLITTVSSTLSKITTSYVSNISAMCSSASVTAKVLNVTGTAFNHTRDPIFMFATGNPLYFLSRVDSKTESTMSLRRYSCGNVLLMTSTFCESAVAPVQLFTGNLPSLETKNILLHARGETLLFVTSTQSPSAGTVLMAVFVSQNITRKSVVLTTEARDIVYPNNGQAHRISGCWISDSQYIVGLEQQQQMWRLTLDTSIAFALLPPTDNIFSYSFIAFGGALLAESLTGYTLTTCMPGCRRVTTDQDAYFAFGNETLTYKRLLPCLDTNVSHVNLLDLRQTPAHTCAVAEFNRSTYYMQYALSFKCKQSQGVISMSLTLDLGAVLRITARNTSMILTSTTSQLLSMHAQCVNMTVQHIDLFDHFACGDGCTLHQVSQVQITGKVHINYVLHSAVRPSDSMIYTQLHSSTYALVRPQLAASFDAWTQHSAFTHTMLDLQRIQVNLMRRTTTLFALSEPTHVAVDVLQVVPVLNLQALLRVLSSDETVLLSLVHIPSDDDLVQLGLLDSTVRGSELSGWRRLHATALVRSTENSLLGCVYDVRLVALDDRFILRQESSKIGCRMRLQPEGVKAVGRCHIEVPFAMANSVGVVGLLLSPGVCDLPPVDSLAVELNPFTSMSECAQHQYLDADTLKCSPCEVKEVVCGPGLYAAGCEAMLWQNNLVACLPCPLPTHARFTNASVTCSDWTCEASFFRSDSLCANCTTSLETVCAKTAGQMWTACAAFANEKCMDCPLSLLPRNAEWTNTSECAWRCRAAYFNNNGMCESCLSLTILKSVLSIQGTRAPGAFYKFRPCTETRQAEFGTCQFQERLNVTYTGDAAEFLDDCPVRCAEYLHKVNTTALDAQNTTWKSAQCIQCPLSSEPTYLDGSLVPRAAYDMDASCSATCRVAVRHYAVEGSFRCAYCPVGRCAYGQYSDTDDGCTSCRNCSSNLLGAFVFQREGLVNNNASCQEMCAPGYYLADDGVQCLPHTDVQCTAGQFKVNGTAGTDARCDECTDCSGYRQVRACSLTQDAKCESCGPLVWWSSFWNGTDCQLACRPAYTKLYMPKARCQRCSTCPNGFERVSQPANCSDCKACAPPSPQHAEYISQCAWKCEKFHILHLDDETGMPQCIYSVDWSTNVPALPPRRQYNISCAKGQKLTDELLCADCLAPSGLNQSELNNAWMWTDVGCAWQCVPGLMHVINTTAQQNSCLTRAQYLALVVARRAPQAPHVRSLNYRILLMVVVPLTFVLVACGLFSAR